MLEHGAHTQDPATLIAAVRTALGRFIVQELNGLNPELPVYTLAPALERVLQGSVNGQGAALEPGLAARPHQTLDRKRGASGQRGAVRLAVGRRRTKRIT